jgi:hypothetical protein
VRIRNEFDHILDIVYVCTCVVGARVRVCGLCGIHALNKMYEPAIETIDHIVTAIVPRHVGLTQFRLGVETVVTHDRSGDTTHTHSRDRIRVLVREKLGFSYRARLAGYERDRERERERERNAHDLSERAFKKDVPQETESSRA